MTFPNSIQVPIQFSGGLNSKISQFSLDQPYLQSLQNGVYNVDGQIDKRTGFTAISTNIQGGGNISQGFALTTFNEELLALDGKNLYSYQKEEDIWISRGSIFSTTNDQVRVLNTKIATQFNPDATSSNNLTLYVWEDNRTFPLKQNGVRYSVINNETNTNIISDQFLYFAGTRPKVITNGENFYISYNAADDTILYATVPISHPNTVTSNYNFICRDGYASIPMTQSVAYDACIFNNNPLYAYASDSGVKLTIGNSLDGYVVDGYTGVQTIGMCVDSFNKVWVAFSNNTDTFIGAWTYNGTTWDTVLSPIVTNRFQTEISVNLALIEDLSLGSVNLTCEVALAGNNNFINNYTVSPQGISTFIGQARGVGLASKPFKNNDNIFINTVWQSNLQATYFTQCLTQGAQFSSGTAIIQAANKAALATSFAIVSKHSPQNGGNYRTNNLLSQCDVLNDGSFIFAGQRKGAFSSYQNASVVNLGVAGYSITFNAPNSFNNVSANNNLHIVGGIKKIYDGVSCVEDNFNLFPENSDGYGCSITNSSIINGFRILDNSIEGNLNYNPLSGPPPGNSYQYIVTYEWTDNYGQVQRSGPSVPITFYTTQSGCGANLVGPMLRITEKVAPRSSVIISIYRTQNSLPIFYKITNDNDPIVNDPTTDTWNYVDHAADQDIGANENLYTNSQIGNTAPPPCSLISLNQQRVMINSTEDPGVIWYSQNKFEQDQYNTLSLDWNTSFIEGVNSRFGNEITAIGLLDAQLAIFKETSIFLLSGDGPNPLNTAGQFNDAQLLVSDTGCTNQNSLVFITQTPNLPGGLLFKSAKGIYLLGRDESLNYIGAPVERYNDLTITSATQLSQSNQVVFTTLEGTILVYNYYFNAWSTWENLPAISACVWQNKLCLIKDNGTVMIQDLNGEVYVDTHENEVQYPVSLSITTPYIKLNGLQGYQSVYNCLLLGTLQGPHTLQVQVNYDYNPSILGAVLIDSTVAANQWGGLPIWGSQGSWGNFGAFGNYQFQININNPRCQSIQLVINDVNNNTFSQGYSLNGLVLECQAYAGPMRLPTGNKTGVQ